MPETWEERARKQTAENTRIIAANDARAKRYPSGFDDARDGREMEPGCGTKAILMGFAVSAALALSLSVQACTFAPPPTAAPVYDFTRVHDVLAYLRTTGQVAPYHVQPMQLEASE